MNKCFVIQPFDNGKFDNRYADVFEPAITKAGLEAYRIDKDLSVRVPIQDIEKGISDSSMCFAEITTDNPNVWYELGFAFACGKDVIMVCSEERLGKFPFDIQHRLIITYKTGSKSDFIKLEDAITNKIKAFLQKANTIKQLTTVPIVETEGLKGHEIALLILIMENQVCSADECISINYLQKEMINSGYTAIAASVGITTLVKKNMIEVFNADDMYTPGQYRACRLTQGGENWLLANQEQLQFKN